MEPLSPREHACKLALERLNKKLHAEICRHKYEMRESRGRYLTIPVRDLEHFYKLIDWSNKNLGQGCTYWTVHERIRRHVDPQNKKYYNPPRIVKWRVFIPGVDISPLLAL